MSDTSPHATESDLRERIRQLEIERDDYKAYTVATLYGYRIYQPDGDVCWRYTRPDKTESELLPTWWLAAKRAMKEIHTAAAGIAAEYLDDTAGGIGGGR